MIINSYLGVITLKKYVYKQGPKSVSYTIILVFTFPVVNTFSSVSLKEEKELWRLNSYIKTNFEWPYIFEFKIN